MVISSTSNQREVREQSGSFSRDSATELTAKLANTQTPLAAARQQLETLHAALDHIHSGLLVLDGELCARYSNPALHPVFKLHRRGNPQHKAAIYRHAAGRYNHCSRRTTRPDPRRILAAV